MDREAAGDQLRDYPDWLSPLLVKDLRRVLDRRATILFFLLFHTLLAVHLLARSGLAESPFSAFAEIVADLLPVALLLLFGWVLPLAAFRALESEASNRSALELSMLALSPERLVLGKWLALSVLLLLAAVSALPYLLASYFAGSLEVIEIVSRITSIALLTLAHTAIVLGCSVLHSRVVRILAILWLVLLGSITSLSIQAGHDPTLPALSFSNVIDALRLALAFTVICWIGLQVGISGLRARAGDLSENPSVYLAGATLLPILQGIGSALAGGIGSLLAMALLFAAGLRFARHHAPKNRLPVGRD